MEVLEIVHWFREQGATLRLEDEPDGSWRAPVIPDGSQVAYVIQGVGLTSVEAAEDAKRRWEAGEQRGKTTVQIGTATETNRAMPITAEQSRPIGTATDVTINVQPAGARAGGNAPTVRVDVPAGGARAGGNAPSEKIEVPANLIERLEAYDQAVLFGDEPDGRVRAYLVNMRTGEIIRSVVEDDLIDAYLELGVDFRPPSPEGREGRAGHPTDPRA